MAPAALYDPGHHVLQAHGLAFTEGVLPDCQPGIVGPHGQPPVGGPYVFNGEPIPAGIFVVLAAVLLRVTFWVLKRRDA